MELMKPFSNKKECVMGTKIWFRNWGEINSQTLAIK